MIIGNATSLSDLDSKHYTWLCSMFVQTMPDSLKAVHPYNPTDLTLKNGHKPKQRNRWKW